jgi:S1-C subfamily serine protease
MQTIKTLLTALSLFLLLTASHGQASDDDFAASSYRRTLRATAWVLTRESSGTGFVVDRSRRWMVTNCHVVKTNSVVNVVFPVWKGGELVDDREYYWQNWQALAIPGRVIHRDPSRDLALIELRRLPRNAPALPLAVEMPALGETIHRVGSPAAAGDVWKLTSGRVHAFGRQTRDWDGQHVNARMIVTKVAGRFGDSGGPVINSRGEVVGVHSSGDNQWSHCIHVKELRTFLAEVEESVDSVSARALVGIPQVRLSSLTRRCGGRLESLTYLASQAGKSDLLGAGKPGRPAGRAALYW